MRIRDKNQKEKTHFKTQVNKKTIMYVDTIMSMYKSPRELWPVKQSVNEKLNPTYKTLQTHRLSQQTMKSGLKNQTQGIKTSASKDVAYWPDKNRFISFGFILELLLLLPCSPRY